jgi:hypothetical protein
MRCLALCAVISGILSAPALAQPTFGEGRRKPLSSAVPQPDDYQPIPLKQAFKTSKHFLKDVRHDYAEVERHWLLDSYARLGDHDPQWDDKAREFIAGLGAASAGAWDAPSFDSLQALGEEAKKQGCNDPLFNAMWGQLLIEGSDNEGAEPILRAALAKIPAEKVSPGCLGIRLLRFAECQRQLHGDDAAAGTFARAIERIVAASAEPNISEAEQRYILALLLPRFEWLPSPIVEAFWRQMQENKNVPEWMRLVIDGRYQIVAAWQSRGGGFGDTVSSAGWRGWNEHLAAARKSLEKAHKAHPDRPEAAALMIIVAMGGAAADGQNERYWLDQMVAAEFDYFPGFESYQLAITPKWGGSFKLMKTFARECADTEAFGTFVPSIYVTTLQSIAYESKDWVSVWREPDVLETCRKVLEGSINDPDQKSFQVSNRTWLAAIAVRARRWDLARQMLDAIPDHDNLATRRLNELHIWSRDVLMGTYPRTTPAVADLVRSADAAAESGDWPRAVELLARAAEKPTGHAETDVGVEELLTSAKIRSALAKGEWVDVQTNSMRPAWRSFSDDWAIYKESASINADGDQLLLLRDPIGRRFELEATIVFDRVDEVKRAGAMIVLGYAWLHDAQWLGVTFWPSSGTVTIGDDWNRVNRRVTASFPKDGMRVHIVCFDERLIVSAGEKVVFDGPMPLPEGWSLGEMIGFASVDGHDQWIRFRGLRIRRLTQIPDGDSKTPPASPASKAR